MRLWWTTLRVLSAALLLIAGCQPAPVVPAPTSAPAAGATPAGQSAVQAVPTTQASSAPTSQPTAKTGGQLVYAVVGSDVRILNPILQSDTVSGAITDRLFEPL